MYTKLITTELVVIKESKTNLKCFEIVMMIALDYIFYAADTTFVVAIYYKSDAEYFEEDVIVKYELLSVR